MTPAPAATSADGLPGSEAGPPPQRVSPITFPSQEPALPEPDASQPAAVRDAFRQCLFALRPDVDWLLGALRLQRRIVEASYPSKYRNHRYAAALLLWSRVYSTGLELLRLSAWGSYAACPPLVRASLEWLAAEQAVVGTEFEEFEHWLRSAYTPESDYAAIDVGMGQYMAGQQIAMAEDLGAVYRSAAELARPHFGASALLVAPESNRKKLALHWGDQAFHHGWAQILFGWQIVIQQRQIRFAVGRGLFGVEAEERKRFQQLSRQAETLLAASARCRTEWIAGKTRERLLVHNFRRQPGGAPQRFLL